MVQTGLPSRVGKCARYLKESSRALEEVAKLTKSQFVFCAIHGILHSENEELMHRYVVVRLPKLFFFLCLLTMVACTQQTDDPQDKNETSSSRPWKLICLGSDWTIGAGLEPEQAYPALLKMKLSALQPVKVVNAGIKGELVGSAADRVDWILQQRLDALLIHYGSTSSGAFPAKELEDWKRLFSKIRLAYPEVPVFATSNNALKNKDEYPEALGLLLEQYDVRWINNNIPDQVTAPQYWHDNREWLSREGQEKIAEQLFSMISPLVKALPK